MMTDGVLEHNAEQQAALIEELQAVRAELQALDANPDLTDEQLFQVWDTFDAQIPPEVEDIDFGDDIDEVD